MLATDEEDVASSFDGSAKAGDGTRLLACCDLRFHVCTHAADGKEGEGL